LNLLFWNNSAELDCRQAKKCEINAIEKVQSTIQQQRQQGSAHGHIDDQYDDQRHRGHLQFGILFLCNPNLTN
jgi:hypothetical protein